MSRLLSILFCIGLALVALGAVYKPEMMGYLAASPAVPIIGMSLLLLPLTVRPLRSVESRYAVWLLFYGLGVSLLSLFIFGFVQMYLAKTITLFILFTIWLSPFFCVGHLRPRHIEIGAFAAIVISLVGYIYLDLLRYSLPSVIEDLLFSADFNDHSNLRARAFMQENSHLAALVGRYLIVLFLLREAARAYSATRLALFMIALIILLVSLGSKGAGISVLFAILVVLLTRRQLPFLIIFAPLLWWAGSTQVMGVAYDIENYTSVSTRATLLLTSVAAVVSNPLGYGYYGFYGAIQHFGGWSMLWLDNNQVPFIFTEVTDIVEQLNNVSTKSTLLDFGMVFGLPFVFMLIALIKRIRLSDPRARAALIYLLFSSLSTSGHESISFFLGLAVLLRFFPKTLTNPSTLRRCKVEQVDANAELVCARPFALTRSNER